LITVTTLEIFVEKNGEATISEKKAASHKKGRVIRARCESRGEKSLDQGKGED